MLLLLLLPTLSALILRSLTPLSFPAIIFFLPFVGCSQNPLKNGLASSFKLAGFSFTHFLIFLFSLPHNYIHSHCFTFTQPHIHSAATTPSPDFKCSTQPSTHETLFFWISLGSFLHP